MKDTIKVRVSIAVIKDEDNPKTLTFQLVLDKRMLPPQQFLEEKLDGMFGQLKDGAMDEVYD